MEVEQITLTGNLALTIPEGHPAGQVYRCAITQDGTGGHTVTYGGAPVAVDLAAGAKTSVTLVPAGTGYMAQTRDKPLPRRQVSGGCGFPASTRAVSNTTDTQVQQVQAFTLTDDVSDLCFTFGNFDRDSQADTNLLGAYNVTVRLGLWDGTATYPIFWPNGARDFTIEPGGVATTHPLYFKGVKGQTFWIVRRMTWATAPTSFPATTFICNTATQVNERGTSLTDRTTSYGQFGTRTAGNWPVFPPLAVTGTPRERKPVVGILGDSITSDGAADWNSEDFGAYGWAKGGLADAGIPYVDFGQAALAMRHILASRTMRAQLFASIAASGVTHMFSALVTNDWASGRTSAQVLADLATLKAELAPLGVKLIPVTSYPKTAGDTDTEGVAGAFASIAAYNAAIRANNGVGDGYYDLAAIAADPNNPNRWRTDLRTAAGISIVSGGSGYAQNYGFLLPGGGVTSAKTVDGSGTVTELKPSPATNPGGWTADPTGTLSAYRQYAEIPAARGIPAGSGAAFQYTGFAATAATSDGTHPLPPMTRMIRMDFGGKAAQLFALPA